MEGRAKGKEKRTNYRTFALMQREKHQLFFKETLRRISFRTGMNRKGTERTSE